MDCHDKHETLRRLESHISRMPDPDEIVRWIERAGLTDIGLDVEQFTLLFKSSREFFFAPEMRRIAEDDVEPAWGSRSVSRRPISVFGHVEWE